ncbi:MAG: amino acid adenylation domain-containing protein [Gammaproteobacteria bacterium]|nr:amino acid adenylation domain-containing protein [Gammaproteobacteria bacterium]
MERSLAEIVHRHEILRTTFALTDEEPIQVVADAGPELDKKNLIDLSETERESRLREFLLAAKDTVFDLAADPLFKTQLIRLDETEHILIMIMHHIIFDGWSKNILLRELSSLYQQFSDGLPSSLPDLSLQYRDYSTWQRNWLQGDVLQKHLDYWKEQLVELPILELPTDYSRPAVQTFNGEGESLSLSQNLSTALVDLSKDRGVTLFTTMLSALGLLLQRYSGQDDLGVGVVITNRDREELHDLIGFFLNTLVMRLDLSGDPTFLELLERVKHTAREGYANQHLPFQKLVEEMQVERDASRTPLFQVSFKMFDAQETGPRKIKDLELNPIPVTVHTARFDLEVFFTECSNGIVLTIVYNTDLFEAATIMRMLAHYERLLAAIVAAPQARLSMLPMLTESERHQLIDKWNQTAAAYPRDKTVHELFEAQAAATPEAVAVVFEGQALTYGELNERANRLAHYLRARGVGAEVLVGLCVERSLEMVIGIFGILKSGGAYLPLDPTYPEEWLRFILEDSQAPLLLTRQERRGTWPAYDGDIVCLDSDWQVISQQAAENPRLETTAENLAYVIYTSGSTGKPKGALIDHRSVINLAQGLQESVYLQDKTARYRVGLNAPIAFDASIKQLVMLLYGHSLNILPQEVRLDPQLLASYLKRNEIDVLDCVPTQLKQLLDTGLLDGAAGLPSIVLCGGEAIDETTWRSLCELKQTRVYNLYGPTECTVDTTICRIGDQLQQPVIGRPINNARVLILDKSLQLVPIGVAGELHIGGDGLARGYLNRPELTAEKFIADPFSDDPGARLYKTGDLVRYRADGNIEYLGRIDQQVKLRGFRIELGEIESVLAGHEAVRDAVVVVRDDEPGEQRLVAYVVADGPDAPSVTDLRALMRSKLPDYMLPSAFMVLDRLPLTANGKLDRSALPMPEGERQSDETLVEPRSDLERQLVEIWAEVLKLERLGIHDNFFDLGGHSLSATQVVIRIRKALQMELPVSQMFGYPTVAELAQKIELIHWTNQELDGGELDEREVFRI